MNAEEALAAGFCLAHGNAASHPFDVLKIVDGGLLVSFVCEVHKGEATLASGLAVKRHRALAHLAVLTEEMNQILPLSVPGQIPNEDRQKKAYWQFISFSHRVPGAQANRFQIRSAQRPRQCALTPIAEAPAIDKTEFIEIGGAHDGRHST